MTTKPQKIEGGMKERFEKKFPHDIWMDKHNKFGDFKFVTKELLDFITQELILKGVTDFGIMQEEIEKAKAERCLKPEDPEYEYIWKRGYDNGYEMGKASERQRCVEEASKQKRCRGCDALIDEKHHNGCEIAGWYSDVQLQQCKNYKRPSQT